MKSPDSPLLCPSLIKYKACNKIFTTERQLYNHFMKWHDKYGLSQMLSNTIIQYKNDTIQLNQDLREIKEQLIDVKQTQKIIQRINERTKK